MSPANRAPFARIVGLCVAVLASTEGAVRANAGRTTR